MNKLFSIAFKRVLASLSVQEITPANAKSVLQNNKIRPIGSVVFHRMARQQLNSFVKIPCPVQNTESEVNKAIINSAKALRANFSIRQRKVCSKCPQRKICPFMAKEGYENTVNALPDLLLYLQAIYNKANRSQQVRTQTFEAGYKVCEDIQSVMEDLKQTEPEILQYEKAKIKQLSEREKENQMNPWKPKDSIDQQKELPEDKPRRNRNNYARQSQENYTQGRERPRQTNQNEYPRKKRYEDQRPAQRGERSRQYSQPRQRRFSLNDEPRQKKSDRAQYYPQNGYRRGNQESYRERPQTTRRDGRNFREDDNKRVKKDKGYEDKKFTRSELLYNERRNHQKSLEKQKQMQMNFDAKFESAGKILRDTKIMEAWEPENITYASRGPSNPVRQARERAETGQRQQFRVPPQSKKLSQQAEPSEPRRGRRIKK